VFSIVATSLLDLKITTERIDDAIHIYIYSIELQIALKLVIPSVCHDAFVSQIWIRQFYLEDRKSTKSVFLLLSRSRCNIDPAAGFPLKCKPQLCLQQSQLWDPAVDVGEMHSELAACYQVGGH
jgi:hypothetical protein